VATRDVFSEDELAQLRAFPEPACAELIRFFTLTPADEEFVRRFRDRKNVLGAAVQLCTLPWLGFVPDDVAAAPAAAVARLSERLGIPVGELRGYGARGQTRTDHLKAVAAHLSWRQVDGPRWKALEGFLFARAMEQTRRSCCSGRRASTCHRHGWSGLAWCSSWSAPRPRETGRGMRRGSALP